MRKLVIGIGIAALCAGVAGIDLARAESHAASGGTEAGTAGTQTGTVVAVEEDVVRIKGSDGKEYEIDAVVVAAEDLKTGDMVEYAIVGEKPVRVKKKK